LIPEKTLQHYLFTTTDFLIDRKPFSDQAAILFQSAINKEVKLYVAAISFNNVYYTIRQVRSHAKTMNLIKLLEQYIEIIAVDSAVLKTRLYLSLKILKMRFKVLRLNL